MFFSQFILLSQQLTWYQSMFRSNSCYISSKIILFQSQNSDKFVLHKRQFDQKWWRFLRILANKVMEIRIILLLDSTMLDLLMMILFSFQPLITPFVTKQSKNYLFIFVSNCFEHLHFLHDSTINILFLLQFLDPHSVFINKKLPNIFSSPIKKISHQLLSHLLFFNKITLDNIPRLITSNYISQKVLRSYWDGRMEC